eukprot:9474628-Pyramimonas_sp.AAC.1
MRRPYGTAVVSNRAYAEARRGDVAGEPEPAGGAHQERLRGGLHGQFHRAAPRGRLPGKYVTIPGRTDGRLVTVPGRLRRLVTVPGRLRRLVT